MSVESIAAVAAALNARDEAAAALKRWQEDIVWHQERIKRSEKRVAGLQESLPALEAKYQAALKEAAKPAEAPAKK